MNRVVRTIAAFSVALGLVALGSPLATGSGYGIASIGSTGCCKQ